MLVLPFLPILVIFKRISYIILFHQYCYRLYHSSQYLASITPAGNVTNSDAAAFKTVKLYNITGGGAGTLVLTLEREDIPFSSFNRTGYYNGSTQSLKFPQWKQTTGEAGNYFANQTIRVELWS